MVKETRIVFDLSDTKALRLKYSHCGREAVLPIARTEVPKQCPLCHNDWEVDYPGNSRGDNWQLGDVMQRFLKAEHPRMTVRFEVDGEG